MIYVTLKNGQETSGHIGEYSFMDFMSHNYADVTEIQADGDELLRCCTILGRPNITAKVYTFLGNNSQEIAVNWYNFR